MKKDSKASLFWSTLNSDIRRELEENRKKELRGDYDRQEHTCPQGQRASSRNVFEAPNKRFDDRGQLFREPSTVEHGEYDMELDKEREAPNRPPVCYKDVD